MAISRAHASHASFNFSVFYSLGVCFLRQEWAVERKQTFVNALLWMMTTLWSLRSPVKEDLFVSIVSMVHQANESRSFTVLAHLRPSCEGTKGKVGGNGFPIEDVAFLIRPTSASWEETFSPVPVSATRTRWTSVSFLFPDHWLNYSAPRMLTWASRSLWRSSNFLSVAFLLKCMFFVIISLDHMNTYTEKSFEVVYLRRVHFLSVFFVRSRG